MNTRLLCSLILLGLCVNAHCEPAKNLEPAPDSETPQTQFVKFKAAAKSGNKTLVRSLLVPAERSEDLTGVELFGDLELLDLKIERPLAAGVVSGPGPTRACDDIWFVLKDGRWLIAISGKDPSLENHPETAKRLTAWFSERKKALNGTPSK